MNRPFLKPMNKTFFTLFLALSPLLNLSAADRQLELAVPFTDNMVLQRHSKVPVWGFDAPGNKVTVMFAGQSKTALADKNGDWMVNLAPLEASTEERLLKVKKYLMHLVQLRDQILPLKKQL